RQRANARADQRGAGSARGPRSERTADRRARAGSAVKRLAAVLLVLLAPLTAHAQECAPGRVLTADGYCCWPAQHWSTERARCEGPPACPSPLMAAGDDCLEPSGIGTPQPPSGSFVGAPDPSYGGALEATQPTGPPGAFWP